MLSLDEVLFTISNSKLRRDSASFQTNEHLLRRVRLYQELLLQPVLEDNVSLAM